MPNTDTTTKAAAAAEIANVDNLLDDLELDETILAEGAEEIVEEDIEEVVDEDVLAGVESDLEREAVYEAQPAGKTDVDTAAPAKAATEPKKGRAKKAGSTTSTPATPRAPRDLADVATATFVLTGSIADIAAMSTADLDKAKVDTMALIPGQKKIAEKFENLFSCLSVNKEPSVFVRLAFKALVDKGGTLTSADIVALYQADGYKEGTARSQAGQIMNLFAAVKIADRASQTLTLRADSTVAERLKSILGV